MTPKFAIYLLLVCVAFCGGTNYDGYKIYDIHTQNDFQKQIILRLADSPKYDFFSLPRNVGAPARVMVSPEDQELFETILQNFVIEYIIVNDNVARSVELEPMQNSMLRSAYSRSRVTFTDFMRYSEINDYLDELAAKYADRVSVANIGKSSENRDIRAITISNGDKVANKKLILIDAGIHAREWIAPAAALYIIYQLVENYSQNLEILRNYDVMVVPLLNPDGYEYSHTTARMWRKTRRPVSNVCYGTDGNRNFDFHWGENGASSLSCAETFKGPVAFSEPETRALRDLMLSKADRIKFYLTLHSYGNYLLYPWGYTSNLPSTWRDLDEVARAGADAIRSKTGTRYTVGSSTNVLYAAAGGSDDYAHGVAKIPISITMELPAGGTGFNPSKEDIKPMVEETFVGIYAMAKTVTTKY